MYTRVCRCSSRIGRCSSRDAAHLHMVFRTQIWTFVLTAVVTLCAQAQRDEVPLPYGSLHSKPAPPGYVALKCTGMSLPPASLAALESAHQLSNAFSVMWHLKGLQHDSIIIDGLLDDACWQAAAWTSDFVDIVGQQWGQPWFKTRVKMLWDDSALYIAAALEEPRAFANQTLHDSIIFQDNDFEVFIDPDGDNWMYYELEVNALGKVWDLFLVRPYRNGGPPIMNWEAVPPREPTQTTGASGWEPLSLAVSVQGAINAAEGSQRWTVELALPWSLLKQAAQRTTPPEPGDRWRINFSRVHWNVTWDEQLQTYVKDPADQPGYNWVWSPQWQVQMHQPETWGYLQFSDTPAAAASSSSSSGESSSSSSSRASGCADDFQPDVTWPARALLMDVYYAQTQCWQGTGHFCTSLEEMGIDNQHPEAQRLQVHTTPFSFIASTTVEAPPSSSHTGSSTGTTTMVLVDQLGRLVQFPVDAQGRFLQEAAYNPFDGSSQRLPREWGPSCELQAEKSALGTDSIAEL